MKNEYNLGFLITVLSLGLFGLCGYTYSNHKKLKAFERAAALPPRVPLLTVTNCMFIAFNGATILRVNDSDWSALTNAYPTNIHTDTVTFYK